MNVDDLKSLLRLESETGRLFWRERGIEWFSGCKDPKRQCLAWNAKFAGKVAGSRHIVGYVSLKIFNRAYLAHRVVFALCHGRWPVMEVDHRDSDRSNNRPDNLREATTQQNGRNRGSQGGTSRFCGVARYRRDGTWEAYGKDAHGRHRHLGRFQSEDEAAKAYDDFAVIEHGEFARLNFAELRRARAASQRNHRPEEAA